MIAFNYRKNKTIHWRVFFDHTFDLLNQILLGFIRFYNSSRMPYLRFFLPIRYHQKAIWLSIRSQRQKRCTIRKTFTTQCLTDLIFEWDLFFYIKFSIKLYCSFFTSIHIYKEYCTNFLLFNCQYESKINTRIFDPIY